MKHHKKYDAYYCKECNKCYNHKGMRNPFMPWEMDKSSRKKQKKHEPCEIAWSISTVIMVVLMFVFVVFYKFSIWWGLLGIVIIPLNVFMIVSNATTPEGERRYQVQVSEANERSRKQQKLEAQRQKQQADIPSSYRCPSCQELISNKAESCPHCGYVTGVHVCPKCGSVDTRVISGTNKAASVLVFGVLAANNVVKTYKCNKCGTKF